MFAPRAECIFILELSLQFIHLNTIDWYQIAIVHKFVRECAKFEIQETYLAAKLRHASAETGIMLLLISYWRRVTKNCA